MMRKGPAHKQPGFRCVVQLVYYQQPGGISAVEFAPRLGSFVQKKVQVQSD